MAVKLNAFPTQSERERITTLRKFQKLYNNQQFAVLGIHDIIKNQYKNLADLVYLSHAVPARITEFYGDTVQGDVDRLIIIANTGNKADEEWVSTVVYENDLKEKISDIAEEQSEFGYTVLMGWVDDNDVYHIDTVPADQYFPQPDGSVIFATYKRDPALPDAKMFLLHTQHYTVDGTTVTIEHQAFRTDEKGIAIETYPLEKMGELIGRTLTPTETIENLDELPIRQIDNGRRTNWGFGKSDYHDIMPQLAELNERSTHASTQLLKNLDAKMALPESSFDENGKPLYSEAYPIASKDEPVPQFIINVNPLLAELREHVMTELKFIEWTSGVPMWALTKGTSPERVETLRIQLFTAVRKTLKKRAKIKRALLDMFRIGAKMTGQSEELQTTDIMIDFSEALPVDELVQIQVESEKIRSGVSSKKSAMKRIENYSEEQANAELERIKAEDQIAGIGNPVNSPTL